MIISKVNKVAVCHKIIDISESENAYNYRDYTADRLLLYISSSQN